MRDGSSERRARRILPALVALVGCHAQAYPWRDFGADLVLGQAEKFDILRYLTERGRFVAQERDFPMEETGIGGAEGTGRDFSLRFRTAATNSAATALSLLREARRGRDLPATRRRPWRPCGRGAYKEVVLTGIDLAAYCDPASGMGLKELLLSFEGQPTPPRIRLSSVDPEYIDADFIEVLAASGKIAKSIHIPAQSGSDRVLKAMRQGVWQRLHRGSWCTA